MRFDKVILKIKGCNYFASQCRNASCNTNSRHVEQWFAGSDGDRRRTCLQYSADVIHLVSNTRATKVMSSSVTAPTWCPRGPTLNTLRTDVCMDQLRPVP